MNPAEKIVQLEEELKEANRLIKELEHLSNLKVGGHYAVIDKTTWEKEVAKIEEATRLTTQLRQHKEAVEARDKLLKQETQAHQECHLKAQSYEPFVEKFLKSKPKDFWNLMDKAQRLYSAVSRKVYEDFARTLTDNTPIVPTEGEKIIEIDENGNVSSPIKEPFREK